MTEKSSGRLALLSAVIALWLIACALGLMQTAASASDAVISEVRVTNVRDTTLDVSWVTDQSATGKVHYGTDPANLDQTAYDDRGAETSDDTHYITLVGLTPNTTYYFDVASDGTTDNNGGAHYTVTTGPTLGLPASDTIYGQVFRADGTTPAEGTVAYITLFDDDGSGNPGEAAPMSALVNSSGYWYTNLGNARTADLGGYFNYSASGDGVDLAAQGAGDGTASQTVDTANDSPAPPMVSCIPISGADFTFAPAEPLVGQAVTFTGGIAQGTPLITYTWALGDETFGSGQVITHTYAVSDAYSVVMTATNACPSQDTATYAVTVVQSHSVYLPIVIRNYSP